MPALKGQGRESRKARTSHGETFLGTEVDKDAEFICYSGMGVCSSWVVAHTSLLTSVETAK